MRHFRLGLAACAVAALLAACGGGGSDTSTDTQITSVQVFGDSLADSGSRGYKFTVQGSSSRIYPELLAATYGAAAPCPVYLSADEGSTYTANPTAGCTSYAVGGGRIHDVVQPTTPRSILNQLVAAGSAGNYRSTDLLVIDGGGNDAADLVGAYLLAASDGGAALQALTASLLGAPAVGAALTADPSGAQLGGLYMQQLATRFYAAIQANALDKGAAHVVLLNIPGITNTPRFQMVLDGIAAAYGGGTAGATARAQSEALFKAWVVAFNDTLAASARGDSRVVLVDVYTLFNQQVANPTQYALQNARDTACPATGLGGDGLPTYDFPNCTDSALSAMTPPSGATGGANWWKSYLFSDGFHPTPYGHQLTYQQISIDLAKSGRL